MNKALEQWRAKVDAFWQARNAQERRTLSIGGAVLGAALFYALLIGPAMDGRSKLQKDLPQLHQQQPAPLPQHLPNPQLLPWPPLQQLPPPSTLRSMARPCMTRPVLFAMQPAWRGPPSLATRLPGRLLSPRASTAW